MSIDIPMLKPMVVTVNTEINNGYEFLLLGTSTEGTTYVLDEKHRKGSSTVAYTETFEELVSWLTDMKQKYGEIIPSGSVGNKNYIQPKWLICQAVNFINYWHSNHRSDTYFKMKPDRTDHEKGLERLKTWGKKDLVKVSEDNCPVLAEELEAITYNQLPDLTPSLDALIAAVNYLANSNIGYRMTSKIKEETEPVSNQQLINRFFS